MTRKEGLITNMYKNCLVYMLSKDESAVKISDLLTIPTTFFFELTTGMRPILYLSMTAAASTTSAFGAQVIGGALMDVRTSPLQFALIASLLEITPTQVSFSITGIPETCSNFFSSDFKVSVGSARYVA